MKYLSSADPSVEEEKSEDGVSKLPLLELLSIAVCMLSKSVLKSILLIKESLKQLFITLILRTSLTLHLVVWDVCWITLLGWDGKYFG